MEIKQKNGKFVIEEAVINEIKDDQIRKLKVGDTILTIANIETPTDQIETDDQIISKTPPQKLSINQRRNLVPKPKGKIIGTYFKNKIYENPLNEIDYAIKHNETKQQIIGRLSLYFTNARYKSLKTYYNMYIRYINGELQEHPNFEAWKNGKPPLEQPKKPQPKTTQKQPQKQPQKLSLGEPISDIAGGVVHKNPLKEMIKSAKTKQDMKDIIDKYYPEVMQSTRGAYYSAYRRYMFDNNIMIPPMKGYKPMMNRRSTKPKKHKKTINRISFSKTYGRWIKKDEIHKVKNAINKTGYNYQPIFSTIKSETKLPDTAIYSVLKYLKEQNELKDNKYTENNEVIYGLKSE